MINCNAAGQCIKVCFHLRSTDLDSGLACIPCLPVILIEKQASSISKHLCVLNFISTAPDHRKPSLLKSLVRMGVQLPQMAKPNCADKSYQDMSISHIPSICPLHEVLAVAQDVLHLPLLCLVDERRDKEPIPFPKYPAGSQGNNRKALLSIGC